MSNNNIHIIPGSFPTAPQERSGSTSQVLTNASATTIVEQENESKFRNKQFIVQKTRHQHHLISQLDTLVYLLVGYQFIKYCHSACILPVLLHIIVQNILSCGSISSNDSNNGGGIRIINDAVTDFINRRRATGGSSSEPSRDDLIRTIYARACSIIYWKAVLTCMYHVLFVCTWVMPIANNNDLYLLENGTWWFISFIGETSPQNFSEEANYWYKLFQLGLPGLIVSDLIILFIQLVLFQCIYKQSTLSPLGRTLNEDELNLIRQTGDFSSLPDRTEIFRDTIPWVLLIKIYELFERKSFTDT